MGKKRKVGEPSHAQLRDIVFGLHQSYPELTTARALVGRLVQQTPQLLRHQGELLRLAEDILSMS